VWRGCRTILACPRALRFFQHRTVRTGQAAWATTSCAVEGRKFQEDFSAIFARDNPHAEGMLSNEDGMWRFTEINLRPVVTVLKKEGRDKVIHVLEKVEKSCLVARSLQCKIVLPYCED
jgi:hypothetical protein